MIRLSIAFKYPAHVANSSTHISSSAYKSTLLPPSHIASSPEEPQPSVNMSELQRFFPTSYHIGDGSACTEPTRRRLSSASKRLSYTSPIPNQQGPYELDATPSQNSACSPPHDSCRTYPTPIHDNDNTNTDTSPHEAAKKAQLLPLQETHDSLPTIRHSLDECITYFAGAHSTPLHFAQHMPAPQQPRSPMYQTRCTVRAGPGARHRYVRDDSAFVDAAITVVLLPPGAFPDYMQPCCLLGALLVVLGDDGLGRRRCGVGQSECVSVSEEKERLWSAQ